MKRENVIKRSTNSKNTLSPDLSSSLESVLHLLLGFQYAFECAQVGELTGRMSAGRNE